MTYFLIGTMAISYITHIILRYINSLHMFQQNVYDTKRYFSWCFEHSEISMPWFDILPLLIWLGIYFVPSIQTLNILLAVTSVFYLVESVRLYRKRKALVKSPLVLTPRAQRLLITSMILLLATLAVTSLLFVDMTNIKAIFLVFCYIVIDYIIYVVVWIANKINAPLESRIRNNFITEAKTKISEMKAHLTVVGITGSYGKTTTKNIVTNVLNEKFYSLMTPASYNTPMGITITIREMLKPIHNIFVCEMGAYKVGEIKELTEIAMPNYGILTAIGPQHLNTFKTIENVQKTKFELIESLGEQGVAILNFDDPLIRSYEIQNKCRILTYGIESEDVDYRATSIEVNSKGIAFTAVFPDKTEHQFRLSILGEHNILNALAAIAVARDLGQEIDSIARSLERLPQIEHRLQLKPAGTYTIIDDAFNANPVGTKKAIDVLEKMDGKRIVITPGMIELGDEEARLNEEYGQYMADKVDFVILVGPKRTVPIYNGLKTKLTDDQIYIAQNLQDAFAKMYQEAIPGSFVLIANDLPDSYNEE